MFPSDDFLRRQGFETLDPRLAVHLAGNEREEVAYAYHNDCVLLAGTHRHYDGYACYVARPVPRSLPASAAFGIASVVARIASYLSPGPPAYPHWYHVCTVLPDFWRRANDESKKLPYPHQLEFGLEQQFFEESLIEVFEQVKRGRLEELARHRVGSA